MADERDFMAAKLNAEGKPDEEADAKNARYTDAFDAPNMQGTMGPGKEPQNRAGPGEGNRAPLAQDTGRGEAQYSVFDGKGNEQVVVATENQQGQPAEGTGYAAATARAEATEGEVQTGSGFGHPDRD